MRQAGENKILYKWLTDNGFTRNGSTGCEFRRWDEQTRKQIEDPAVTPDYDKTKVWRVWLHSNSCQAEIRTGQGYRLLLRGDKLKTVEELYSFFFDTAII